MYTCVERPRTRLCHCSSLAQRTNCPLPECVNGTRCTPPPSASFIIDFPNVRNPTGVRNWNWSKWQTMRQTTWLWCVCMVWVGSCAQHTTSIHPNGCVTFRGKWEFKHAYQLQMICECVRDSVVVCMCIVSRTMRPDKVRCSWSNAFTLESSAFRIPLNSPRYLCNYSTWHFAICHWIYINRSSSYSDCPILSSRDRVYLQFKFSIRLAFGFGWHNR